MTPAPIKLSATPSRAIRAVVTSPLPNTTEFGAVATGNINAQLALIAAGKRNGPLLVDQGDLDSFLAEQLKPELLMAACEQTGIDLTLRMQPGYDHSYFFIASFIGSHVADFLLDRGDDVVIVDEVNDCCDANIKESNLAHLQEKAWSGSRCLPPW